MNFGFIASTRSHDEFVTQNSLTRIDLVFDEETKYRNIDELKIFVYEVFTITFAEFINLNLYSCL